MPLKQWLCVFLVTSLLCTGLLAGFNALVDPFGLFGDKLFGWWAYGMTQNPRTAKIGWVDKYHDNYDSYIVGCSKTSSFPTELLNLYFGGARFYNMTMYGGDLYDAEMTVKYLLGHYGAKNIVVNMGLEELARFNYEYDGIKGNLHAKVDGSSLPLFYARYLFANPGYAVQKLTGYWTSGYLVDANKVFTAETGAYDKCVRDTEPIGSLEDYLDKYPVFNERNSPYSALPDVDACVAAIASMKEACETAGATLTLIVSPLSATELDLYPSGDLMDFFRKLSSVTDYWDFSGYHSVALEPRYFYDVYHHRNAVGAMALARMFGDDGVYVPEDFGVHVSKGNIEARLEGYARASPEPLDCDQQVPILLYHDISDAPGSYSVSAEAFRAQLQALKKAGYETVSFPGLIGFVEHGTPLPKKPLVITFDDGYENNITIAAPILAEYGMCAAINVIGVSVGKDTYKDSAQPIIPHFSFEEADPGVRAGVLDIQSHSFDMHNSPELDRERYRRGVLRIAGEDEMEYIAAFRADLEASRSAIERALGTTVTTYAYPFGLHTYFTEVLLSEMGIKVSLTVEEGMNTLVKGLPQSLLCLKRCSVGEDLSPEELVQYLEGLR